MPEAFTLGPLLIPTRAASFILSLLLLFWLVQRIAAYLKTDVQRSVEIAEQSAWLGLLAARMVFALFNLSSYSDRPWTVLYFWQPGYNIVAGVLVAGAYIGYRVIQQPRVERKALVASLMGGLSLPAVLLAGVLLSMNRFADGDVVVPGRALPVVQAQAINGRPVSFSEYAGNGLVVNFWATWCPPCRREMPLLESVYQEFKKQGVVVLGIATDAEWKTVQEYLAKRGVNYPVWQNRLLAESGGATASTLSGRFGVVGFPTTFFIDAQGVVQSSYVGELNRALLDQRIAVIRP